MVALVGVGVFAVVCGAVQFLRTDYNPLGMPLSFYVIGPYGRVVEGSFFVLAVGLAALGAGCYRALARGARSAAPLLLFVVAAIALCITAVEFTDIPGQPSTLHGYVHVIAAVVSFLCVTVAMLLQSWRFRLDARGRDRFRSAIAIAAVAFVALWIDAVARPIPRGLGEKIVIVLILIWLWRAAWWLVRASPIKPLAPPAPHHGAPRTP
ncbi:MAG: DUF998 domain-containing protein [Rhodanobacteraceae bacterium]